MSLVSGSNKKVMANVGVHLNNGTDNNEDSLSQSQFQLDIKDNASMISDAVLSISSTTSPAESSTFPLAEVLSAIFISYLVVVILVLILRSYIARRGLTAECCGISDENGSLFGGCNCCSCPDDCCSPFENPCSSQNECCTSSNTCCMCCNQNNLLCNSCSQYRVRSPVGCSSCCTSSSDCCKLDGCSTKKCSSCLRSSGCLSCCSKILCCASAQSKESRKGKTKNCRLVSYLATWT